MPAVGFGPFNPQSGYLPGGMTQPGFGSVPLPRPRPDNLMTQPGFGDVPLPRPRPATTAGGQPNFGFWETIKALAAGNPVPPNQNRNFWAERGNDRGANRDGIKYRNNFSAENTDLMMKYGLLPGPTSLI